MDRIKWIDTAKGIAIVFIVLGHTLRSGLVHNIVYCFHVPVFFFLSGITVKEALTVKNIKTDFQRLLIPYYSFGFISIAVYAFLGSVAASHFDTSTASVWDNVTSLLYGASWLKFNAPLWFLPALFAAKLWYRLLHCLTKGNTAGLAGIAAVGCVLSFCCTGMGKQELPFSFALVLKLFPYFLAGKVCAPALIKLGKKPRFQNGCGCVAGGLLTAVCILGGDAPPVNYTNHQIPIPLVFYGIAIVGCLGVYCAAVYIEKVKWLGYLGRKTLSVLVMHKFPIVFFQVIGPFKDFLNMPDSLEGVLLGGIPVTILSILMSLTAGCVIERIYPILLGIPQRVPVSEKRK